MEIAAQVETVGQGVVHLANGGGEEPRAQPVVAVRHTVLGDIERLAQRSHALGGPADSLRIHLAPGAFGGLIAAWRARCDGSAAEELAGAAQVEADDVTVIDVEAYIITGIFHSAQVASGEAKGEDSAASTESAGEEVVVDGVKHA